jgi:hypothetical protein
VVEVATTNQVRVDLDARGLQRGAVPVDAGPAAQHRDRPTDHRDPPVPEPEQMPRRREPAGPVRRAHRRDIRLRQLGGGIDQHVRNVSVGQDALIHWGQFGSHDDRP